MSLADEVRRWHRPDTGDEGWCGYCPDQAWPCAAIRLADSHDELLAVCEKWIEYGIDHIEWCASQFMDESCDCGAMRLEGEIDAAIERAKRATP